MLELKGITKKEANQKIKEEIKLVQQKVENFKKLGYNIYERDYTNDMYSVNNVTEYFMGENNALYIIYAYGNQNYTSEMDIVVIILYILFILAISFFSIKSIIFIKQFKERLAENDEPLYEEEDV